MHSWFHRSGKGESSHVGDEELLLLIDGELSPGRREQVRRHLEACWSCRSRSQKMQSAITEFAAAQRESQAAVRPPKQWREFAIRLEQLDSQADTGGFLPHFFGSLLAPVSWSTVRLVVSVMVVCGLLLWFWGAQTPVVYAKELLQRAKAVEGAGLLDIADPWFYQRLSVEKQGAPGGGNITATIEVWNRVAGNGVESRGRHRLWEDLHRIARVNGIEGLPLLSAEAFAHWRENAGRIRESVKPARLPDGTKAYVLTVTALDPGGDWHIREGRLVVRAADWMPVRLSWTIAAGGVVEIYRLRRIESKIVSGDSLPSFVVSLQRAPVSPLAATTRPARLRPPAGTDKPTPRKLDLIELRAWYALHRHGDCLRGNLRVVRTGMDRISVNGLVETTEAKEALLLLLPRSRWLEADIKSIEELERERPVPSPESLAPVTVGTAPTSVLPVEKLLREYFGAEGAAGGPKLTHFLDSAVRQAQALRREAWALRNLAERYGGNTTAELPGRERLMLGTMVQDHTIQILALSRRNEAMLGPFLSWVGEQLDLPPVTVPRLEKKDTGWGELAMAVARRADRFDDLVRDLFAGGGPGSLPLKQGLAELAAVTGRARLDSVRLARIIRTDFLPSRQLAAAEKIE